MPSSHKKSGNQKVKGEKQANKSLDKKADDKKTAAADDDLEPNSGFGNWLRSDDGWYTCLKIKREKSNYYTICKSFMKI